MRLILFLLLSVYLVASDFKNVSVNDFISIVSKQSNKAIYLDSDINSSISLYVPNHIREKDLFRVFKSTLKKSGLTIKKIGSLYYVTSQTILKPKNHLYTIHLNNFVYPSIKPFLKELNIKSTYFETSNTFSFSTTPKVYKSILKVVNSVDVPLQQLKFKITIFSTNLDILKDKGFNLSAYARSYPNSSNVTYFLNLITMPYTLSNNLVSNARLGFYSVLKFLTQKGYTTITNSQILTALNAKKVVFTSSKNIPYLSSVVTNSQSSQQVTQNLNYKDVGLKVILTPYIKDNTILLNLDLKSEDLISNTDNKPITNKKTISSVYKLKKGQILIISGFNSTTSTDNHFGVPFVENIPYVGKIFKYDTKSNNHSILTISIEAL